MNRLQLRPDRLSNAELRTGEDGRILVSRRMVVNEYQRRKDVARISLPNVGTREGGYDGAKDGSAAGKSGVGNGNRTRNRRSHSPVLCQLSYSHRHADYTTALCGCQKRPAWLKRVYQFRTGVQ